jgi:hypothetical protein
MSVGGYEEWKVRVDETEPELFTLSNPDGTRYDLTGLALRLAVTFGSARIEMNSDADARLIILDQTESADTRGQFTAAFTPEERLSLPREEPARFAVWQNVDNMVSRLVWGDLTAEFWVLYDAG